MGGGGQQFPLEDNAPWAAGALFGKSGSGLPWAGGAATGSGIFNTFTVPFGVSVNVTVALGCPSGSQRFWLIVRGHTRASLTLPGGYALPAHARLRSFEKAITNLPPLAQLPLANSTS